jgi:hypothetical protein
MPESVSSNREGRSQMLIEIDTNKWIDPKAVTFVFEEDDSVYVCIGAHQCVIVAGDVGRIVNRIQSYLDNGKEN